MLEKQKGGHHGQGRGRRGQVTLGLEVVVIMNAALHIFQLLPSRYKAGLHFLALFGGAAGPIRPVNCEWK